MDGRRRLLAPVVVARTLIKKYLPYTDWPIGPPTSRDGLRGGWLVRGGGGGGGGGGEEGYSRDSSINGYHVTFGKAPSLKTLSAIGTLISSS